MTKKEKTKKSNSLINKSKTIRMKDDICKFRKPGTGSTLWLERNVVTLWIPGGRLRPEAWPYPPAHPPPTPPCLPVNPKDLCLE